MTDKNIFKNSLKFSTIRLPLLIVFCVFSFKNGFSQDAIIFEKVSQKLQQDKKCYNSYCEFVIVSFCEKYQATNDSLERLSFDYYTTKYNELDPLFRLIQYNSIKLSVQNLLTELDNNNSLLEICKVLKPNNKQVKQAYRTLVSNENNFNNETTLFSKELIYEYYESYLKNGTISVGTD